jgi:hypothetical protein
MSIEFYQTGYGRRFFDQQLPDLINAVSSIAAQLKIDREALSLERDALRAERDAAREQLDKVTVQCAREIRRLEQALNRAGATTPPSFPSNRDIREGDAPPAAIDDRKGERP